MDSVSDSGSLIDIKRLSSRSDYYNNVFKKTEKVVSAVFYILSHIPHNETTRIHHEHLSTKALALHDAATASLNLYEYEAREGVHQVQHALVVLESALTITEAARLVNRDIARTVADEVDLILRYLRNHVVQGGIGGGVAAPRLATTAPRRPAAPRRTRPQIPKNDMSSDAIMVYSALTDRTTRIKTVLEAKPNATINDLTDIITDVSAKTIQRDLNSLIERGEVMRQGERRWSTYSVVS